MIPVEDFGEWYEDVTLGAIAADRLENDNEPPLPLAEFIDDFKRGSKWKASE